MLAALLPLVLQVAPAPGLSLPLGPEEAPVLALVLALPPARPLPIPLPLMSVASLPRRPICPWNWYWHKRWYC